MKPISMLLCAAVLVSTAGGAAWAGSPPGMAEASIGLLSKVILDVARKEANKEWQKAKRGETLGSGDRVRTGERSVAIIKFKDNSLVRVRELSELTVTGDSKGTAFSKSVDVLNGVVGFNVKKQRTDEEFRFTSPTSVASIRGTGGLFSTSAFADTLTVTEGSILFTNRFSSQSITVPAGFTGVASPQGAITSHPSTPGEQQAAQSAMSGDQSRRLELELRDSQGKTRLLRLDITE